MDGLLVKGIGGFYYVLTDGGIVESKARGVFREENIVPMIGDKVRIRISDEDGTGYIKEIYPRETQLTRPAVSNVTQAIIVMSIKDPKLNPWLLDRFIMMSEYEGLKTVICINKSDLEDASEVIDAYRLAGYDVIETSALEKDGIDDLKEVLEGEISVFTGPSGVGKSSLLNLISKEFELEVGGVSEKSRRGKHTTRHVELLILNDHSFVVDTPGFSSIDVSFIEDESTVRHYFKEIDKYGAECRFLSCLHKNEPGCNVKAKVEEGVISPLRYKNYIKFLDEIKNIRRY